MRNQLAGKVGEDGEGQSDAMQEQSLEVPSARLEAGAGQPKRLAPALSMEAFAQEPWAS